MNNQQDYLKKICDIFYHKMISSSDTRLTAEISDLVISEGMTFNIASKL